MRAPRRRSSARAIVLVVLTACSSHPTATKVITSGGGGECFGQSRSITAVNPAGVPAGTLAMGAVMMTQSTVDPQIQMTWWVQRNAVPGTATTAVLRDSRDTTKHILQFDALPTSNTALAFGGTTTTLNGNVAPESVWEIVTSAAAEIAFKATGTTQEVRLPLAVQSKLDWAPRVCLF